METSRMKKYILILRNTIVNEIERIETPPLKNELEAYRLGRLVEIELAEEVIFLGIESYI